MRCSGHVFNLVGLAALYGSDSEAFAEALKKRLLKSLNHNTGARKSLLASSIISSIGSIDHRSAVSNSKRINKSIFRPASLIRRRFTALSKMLRQRGTPSITLQSEPATFVWQSMSYCLKKDIEYRQYRARCEQANRLIKRQPPPILDDMLSTDDWAVIAQYVAILKPLKDATLALEG